jgi:hypothetical protein
VLIMRARQEKCHSNRYNISYNLRLDQTCWRRTAWMVFWEVHHSCVYKRKRCPIFPCSQQFLAAQRPHKIHAYVNVILTTQKEHTKSSPNKDKDVMSLKIGLCDLREGCWPLQEKTPRKIQTPKWKTSLET